MYKIIYSPKAIEDLQKLKRSEPAAYKKADKFPMDITMTNRNIADLRKN